MPHPNPTIDIGPKKHGDNLPLTDSYVPNCEVYSLHAEKHFLTLCSTAQI